MLGDLILGGHFDWLEVVWIQPLMCNSCQKWKKEKVNIFCIIRLVKIARMNRKK